MEGFDLKDFIIFGFVFVAVVVKFGIIGYMAYKNSQKDKEHMRRVMEMKDGKPYDSTPID